MFKVPLLVFIFTFSVSAQITAIISDKALEARGDSFTVSLNVENFYNAGAVSFIIEYDTASLKFTDIRNTDERILFNAYNGRIYIAYANLLPLSIINGRLFDFNFKHIKGNSYLYFSNESEAADINGEILSVEYSPGHITDPEVKLSALGNRVWIDANRNGIQDNNETGLPWVTVDLFDCTGRWLAYTLSDQSGYYTFTNLDEGEYYLQFSLIDNNASYVFTVPEAGSDHTIDSDAYILNEFTAVTGCITLAEGEELMHFDAGVYIKGGETLISYHLSQNFPNPFNSATSFQVILPVGEFINISVYNILGEKVNTVLNNYLDEGMHQFSFNAENLKSGVYFLRVITPSAQMTRKMVLSR